MKKPRICVYDADSLLFEAASAGEQVWYIAKDENGEEVGRFDSAEKYKNWIESIKFLEYDVEFGYEGDIDKLTRETFYEIKDFELCKDTFKNGLRKALKMTGCKEVQAYISKKSGAKVFRYNLATIHEYKAGRKEQRKPFHLEELRKFAMTLPEVKVNRGNIEVDDKVIEVAEKLGEKACLLFIDKDALQARGCWIYHIGRHTKPVWSSPKIIGRIGKKEDGQTRKLGYLSLLYQMITGDKQVDGIVGIPRKGDTFAFKLLKEYDNKPVTVLPEAVESVLRVYYDQYGLSHTYDHWDGSVEITATYKDMFEENLLLLWMRRFKNDDCRVIMDIVDKINFEKGDE